MEVKVIIYIVGAILYILYSVGKRVQEKQKANPTSTGQNTNQPTPKPVTPPIASPLEEIRREMKRKQLELEAEAKARLPNPQSVTTAQREQPEREIFIREVKKASFGQGAADSPVYEDPVIEKEKAKRGDIRLKNEGIYQVETMEEARAAAEETAPSVYEFDAKQAFIGSVIFERKYC